MTITDNIPSSRIPQKIVVLMGGWSSEREISLLSGKAVTQALITAGFDAVEVDVTKDIRALLCNIDNEKPDVIFNALHGTGGEDGTIQGVLDMAGIPYTHSGVAASSLAMNKVKTKHIVAMEGVPVAEEKVLKAQALTNGHPMPAPYVIKPVADGSSVGVFIIHNDNDTATLNKAVEQLGNTLVMAERYISGKELTVAVLEDTDGKPSALTVTELQSKNDFYDFEAKYTNGKTDHIVGTALPTEVTKQLLDYAVKAHKALGCRHLSRSDFRYNETDGVIYLETNTQPGMTALSLVPEQAQYCGITFPELVKQLVVMAYNGS